MGNQFWSTTETLDRFLVKGRSMWPDLGEVGCTPLDRSLVSDDLVPHIKKAFIDTEHEGSDHCPVGLTITL